MIQYCERRQKMKEKGFSLKLCKCNGKIDNCNVIEDINKISVWLSGCCTIGYPR